MKLKSYFHFYESKSIETTFNGNYIVFDTEVTDGKFNKKFPDVINGNFDCEDIGLKSLTGCPKTINGNFFSCNDNFLTNLKGFPNLLNINTSVYLVDNKLTSLEGCIKTIHKSLHLRNNLLKSLEHGPIYVGDVFSVDEHLEIERDFIKSEKCTSTNPKLYWNQLLDWMINEDRKLDEVYCWPQEFIDSLEDGSTKNELKSLKGLNKFKL